jgi:PAS domain S-box-containing protein
MDYLDRKVVAVQQKVKVLQWYATAEVEQVDGGPSEVLEELQTALEELWVAEEELRQQNDELVAARQAAELERQRYQELFEFAPDGYLVTDALGTIREANRAATAMLAVPQERMLGKPLAVFVVEAERHAFRTQLNRLPQVHRVHDWEVRLQPREGAPLQVALSVAATSDQQGKVGSLRWLLRDISASKRLEEQLRQSQKMQAIGTLAVGIAHDFNNMLQAILGYTTLAQADVPQQESTWQDLQEVLIASRRAKELVQQILTFGRRSEPTRQPVQLHLVVQEVLSLLRGSLPTTIDIRQYLDPTADTVLADPLQLHQVLVNLCTNAEYAMRGMGGILEIRLDRADVDTGFAADHPPLQPGKHARLTVRDTGGGMEPTVMARIFEPFFTTKGVGEGSGMGLAVVHGIIANHGGAITVESTPGHGTTFTVYLPRVEDVAAEEPPLQAAVRHGMGGRILFVEDESTLARLSKIVLEELGYEVVICTDSRRALDVFQAEPQGFDLVITDQTMPHMTGDVLAGTLRHIRPDIPLILCTGFSHTMDAEKAKTLGIDAFLMKPVALHDWELTIQRVLARQRGKHL